MPLREDLLQPIPGPNPSGSNLAFSPLFEEIKLARRSDSGKSMVVGDLRETRKVEHSRVIELVETAIAEQSKDLWLAAWLTEALLLSEHFSGLKTGLDLTNAMVERFWDTLFPELEKGDAEVRCVPLDWLGNYLEPDKGSSPALAAQFVPLTKSNLNYIHYRESEALRPENARTKDQRDARESALKEGKTSPELFEKAFTETPKSFYKTLHAELTSCIDALKLLDKICTEKFGRQAPSFKKLHGILDDIRATVYVLLGRKLQLEPDPIEKVMAQPAGDGITEQLSAVPEEPLLLSHLRIDGEKVDAIIRNELKTGEDVVLRMAALARHLRQREPSSPVSYLLLRAFRWGELRNGQALADLLEAPPAEIRAKLRQLSKEGNWKLVLEVSETAMSESFGRAWVDVQRYAIRACDELGYTHVAKALRSELKALLTDLPDLPNMILPDDTGAANPETLAWLRKEGFVPSS